MKYSLLNINFYILIVLNQIDFTECILPNCARKMMRGTYQSHLIAQSFFLSYFVNSNFMMTLCFSSSLLVFYMKIYWFEKLSQNIWYISINKKKIIIKYMIYFVQKIFLKWKSLFLCNQGIDMYVRRKPNHTVLWYIDRMMASNITMNRKAHIN